MHVICSEYFELGRAACDGCTLYAICDQAGFRPKEVREDETTAELGDEAAGPYRDEAKRRSRKQKLE